MVLPFHDRSRRLSFPLGGILNKDLRFIFTSNFIGSFGDGLYAFLLPYYMKEQLGISPIQIGTLYAIAYLMAACTLLLGGFLADRYDRKKVMILGWLIWSPIPLIFSLAENWIQILPGMILWGFWLGGPTSAAYIATSADKGKLTLTFTAISASWSLGYIISPALGGYISSIYSMKVVFYLAFIFYSLAGVVLLPLKSQYTATLSRGRSDMKNFLKIFRTGRILKVSVLFSTVMLIIFMFRPFIPQFVADLYGFSGFEVGLLGSITFLGSALLGLFAGRIGDLYGKTYAISISLMLYSASLILLSLSYYFPVLVVAFFLGGSSYIFWSLMNAFIAPLAPNQIMARWISIPQAVALLSSFLAPYLGGYLYELSPYNPVILSVISASILAVLILKGIFSE